MRGNARKFEILTSRQQRALVALLEEPTREDAAKRAGVNPATLYRWLREPAFREALAEARRDAFSQATTAIAAAASRVAAILIAVAEDEQAAVGARVSACRAILEHARQAIEMDDLSERLDALEKRQAAQKGQEDGRA